MELEILLHAILLCLTLISLITVGIFKALVCFFVVDTMQMQTHVGPWASGFGPKPRVPFVPASISRYTDLKSAAAVGWTLDSLGGALEIWQTRCIHRVYDVEIWIQHGPFDGVFEFIRNRLSFNSKRCGKRTTAYWEMEAP